MGTRSFRPLVAPFVVGITTRLFGNNNNNRQQPPIKTTTTTLILVGATVV
jgi:hypothetical protein